MHVLPTVKSMNEQTRLYALYKRFDSLTNLEINMDYVSRFEITKDYVDLTLICESIGLHTDDDLTQKACEVYKEIAYTVAEAFKTYPSLCDVINSEYFWSYIPGTCPRVTKKVIITEKIKNIIRNTMDHDIDETNNADEIWVKIKTNNYNGHVNDYITISIIKSEVYYRFREWILNRYKYNLINDMTKYE